MRAILALEDGRFFEGESFGATGARVGEICFNTAMTGYQEVLTDPSYRGQIVAMTYPLIGNYGTNSLDQESGSPHVRGFVIEELSETPSNWRSEMSLDEYLRKWDIPGVQRIDTRALTRHLRTRGAMKACLTTEEISPEEATQRAIEGEGVIGMDYVREVSTPEVYQWDPNDELSKPWTIANGNETNQPSLSPIRFRIAAYDYGIKQNILRLLRQKGFGVTVTRFDGQNTDLRHLPRPSNSRFRFWRIDIQIKIRPSRRESAGQRSKERKGRDHRAKPRFRGRSRIIALECRSHSHQLE